MYRCRLGIACGRCIRPRRIRGSSEEEDEFEEGGSEYLYTLSHGSPERSDGYVYSGDEEDSCEWDEDLEENSQGDTDEQDESE